MLERGCRAGAGVRVVELAGGSVGLGDCDGMSAARLMALTPLGVSRGIDRYLTYWPKLTDT